MGFDANDDNRVILSAYAYTGDVPKFLGTWSIDVEGNNAKLEDLEGASIPVSMVGYKLAEDSLKDMSEIEFDAKQAKEKEKNEEEKLKEAEKFDKQIKKLEYQRKIRQMDMETWMKVQEKVQERKEMKVKSKFKNGITGLE